MRTNNSFHTSNIKNLQSENKALRLQLLQEQEKLKNLTHQPLTTTTEVDRVNDESTNSASQAVSKLTTDNNNLLSELHKVQEELEIYFSQSVPKLTSDNKNLLSELHKAQEELERHLNQSPAIEIKQGQTTHRETKSLLHQLYETQTHLESVQLKKKNQQDDTPFNESKLLLRQLYETQIHLEKASLKIIELEKSFTTQKTYKANIYGASNTLLSNQSVEKLIADNKHLLSELHKTQEELEHYFSRSSEDKNNQHSNADQNNELTLRRLHQVQSELENARLTILSQKRNQSTDLTTINNELYKARAEIQRLRVITSTQTTIHQLEMQYSLSSQLGNILIKGFDTPKGWIAAPGQLLNLWRNYRSKQPPEKLGGKNFNNIIQAYEQNGFSAVEELLQGIIAPAIIGNAYTALARHLIAQDNKAQASVAARHAYNADPKPYRLKWLAFRLHENNEILEAEAILDILPKDTSFSESESRQVAQLRYEAFQLRLSNAQMS